MVGNSRTTRFLRELERVESGRIGIRTRDAVGVCGRRR